MKKTLTFLLLILAGYVHGQKHDNQWYSGGHIQSGIRNNNIDFGTEPPKIFTAPFNVGLQLGNYTFNDSLGNLLFFTNGLRVWNKNHAMMQNGDSIVTDFATNLGDYSISGYPAIQTIFAIYEPNSDSRVWLLQTGQNRVARGKIVRTIIDIKANQGLGRVVSKNETIYEKDTAKWGDFAYKDFDITKHANGRDWWLVVAPYVVVDSIFFDRLLLSPLGVSPPQRFSFSHVNTVFPTGFFDGKSGMFSQDGTKYVHSNGRQGELYAMDFDRCDGTLYNFRAMSLPIWSQNVDDGINISPDNRFVYLCRNGELMQIDLSEPNPTAQLDTVSTSVPPWWSVDGSLQYGPDGRLYMKGSDYYETNTQPVRSMWHAMNFPNRKGKDCGIAYRKFFRYISQGHRLGYLPYYPNYRLGPLDGTVCDSLGLDNRPLCNWRYELEDTAAHPFRVTFADNTAYEPTSWAWDFGGLGSGTGTEPVFEFPGPGTYHVCLTACNANACDTLCRDITLGYPPPPVPVPVAHITVPDTVCLQQTVTFSTGDTLDPIDFYWDLGAAFPQHLRLRYGKGPHTVKYTTLGPQQLLLTATNLAGADTLIKTIEVIPLAAPKFTYTVSGDTVFFVNTAQHCDAGGFTWDFGDGSPLSMADAPYHVYDTSGYIVVRLTGRNQCSEKTFGKEVLSPVSGTFEADSGGAGGLWLWPNPSAGEVSVRWDAAGLGGPAEIWVTDLLGRVVLQRPVAASLGALVLDAADWTAGIYWVTLRRPGAVGAMGKVVIQH